MDNSSTLKLIVVFCCVTLSACNTTLTMSTEPTEQSTASPVTPVSNVTKATDSPGKNNATSPWPTTCMIKSVDEYMHQRVHNLIEERVKLIEYTLSFPNYTVNPLTVNLTWSYKSEIWTRVSSVHGQTLLSLAFNYGVLSLMTLTMGTSKLDVELLDEPRGCFGALSENNSIDTVMYLLMRDFKHNEDIQLVDDERICHEIIMKDGSKAMFKDRCCHRHELTMEITCDTTVMNIWLTILHTLLSLVRFTVLFFGPMLFIPVVESLSNQNFPYVVKLKDPLYKTLLVAQSDTHIPTNYKCGHILDFRGSSGLSKLRISASDIPLGHPTKVRICEYNLLVDYRKLLPENNVPVGLWTSISHAVFQCRLREVGPFKRCCKANMLSLFPEHTAVPWIALWKKVGLLLMILLMPTPYYLRLVIYYCFEIEELNNRKDAAQNIGLSIPYDKSLLHFLSPTHALFLSMYCLYFLTAVLFAYKARTDEQGKFRRMLVGAFTDLKLQSWIKIFQVAVKNFVWPFQRYGAVGCAVAILYWPVAIPYSIIMFLFFCLPAVYMTARMIYYSKVALTNKIVKRKRGRSAYRIEKTDDKTTNAFDIAFLHNKCMNRKETDDDIESMSTITRGSIRSHRSRLSSTSTAMSIISQRVKEATSTCKEIVSHVTAAILLIVTMYSVLFLLSECIGCVVEIVTFTLMGVIINAGAVLKYVMLLLLVMLYCFDTFNNVPKKYLKLNKAIFNEVKGRCKDLDKVTSLPSSLQVNFGFKSQELGEQADYESPDDIWKKVPRHWLINDLTLFVDNEDFPRIPKRLFEDVCQIRVAGAPGPVWRALIDAFKDLIKIVTFLLFVFLIVLSFGFVYQVSTTNQMLATVAGGFLPFLLKTFMAPNKPDIEIGTVSFKSKMDEIIKNFYQIWPIYDFPFDVLTQEEIDELENAGKEDEKEGSDKGSTTQIKQEDPDEPQDSIDGQPGKHDPLPPAYDDAKRESLFPFPPKTNPINKEAKNKDMNQNLSRQSSKDKTSPLEKSSLKTSNHDLKKIPSQSEIPGVTFEEKPFKRPTLRRQKSKAQPSIEMTPLSENPEPEFEVDILIFLPERRTEDWLEQWSDYDEYNVDNVISDDEIDESTALRVDMKDSNAVMQV